MRKSFVLLLLLVIAYAVRSQNVWTGSGFALNKGYIATNWHVVDGAETIVVYGINGDFTQPYPADVVVKDKVNDLAIIKISGDFKGFGSIPYKIVTRTADVGESIFVLGFPMTDVMGDELKCTDGIISSLSGFDGDVSTYQISAPIQHGNSGGPVFDENGNIIGIACAGIDNKYAQNANYAVKSRYLENLSETMHESSVLPNGSQMRNYSKLPDKIKAVRNFVFYIVCTDVYIPSSAISSTSNSAQAQTTISVYPNSVKVSSKEETAKFEISTNAEKWRIASMPDWCHVVDVNGMSVTISIDANKIRSSRTDYITFETNDGKTVSVAVNQEAKEFSEISLSPSSFVGGKDVRSVKFEVITDASSWDVVGNPQWCTYKKRGKSLELLFREEDVDKGILEEVRIKTNDGVEATASIRINLYDVVFYCETPAEIFVDGISRCSVSWGSECKIKLNSGEHLIEAKREFYKTYKETFVVQDVDNQSLTIKMVPLTSRTAISSNVIGASIYIDDKCIGTTNGTFDLPLGQHSIRCTKDGYDTYESTYSYWDENPHDMNILMEIETKLTIPVKDFTLPSKRGSTRIEINSNKPYEVLYPNWTKIRYTKSGLKLMYEANKGNVARSSNLTIRPKNGLNKQTISIWQSSRNNVRTSFYRDKGDWAVTWFKAYGFCGVLVYGKDDYDVNYGGTFDFLVFRVKMFELSLASFGYDEYACLWDWTPRVRLNIPVWDSGALFTDFGFHMNTGDIDEFFVQIGVQWLYTDWNYIEAFLRYGTEFSSDYAISAGLAIGFCSGY